MTPELTLLVWTALLAFVQLGAAAVGKRLQESRDYSAGPRDEPPPVYSAVTGRLLRAHANLMETLPLFAIAVLVCHVAGRDGTLSLWGAHLYFWSRLLYLPIYALGIAYVRTLVWIVGIIGLLMICGACL